MQLLTSPCPRCNNRPKVFVNDTSTPQLFVTAEGTTSYALACVWCKEAGPDPEISFNPRVASQQWNDACIRFAQSMITRAKAQAQRREESVGTVQSSNSMWL